MYVYIYMCVYIYIYAYMYICICIYIYIYIYIHIYIYTTHELYRMKAFIPSSFLRTFRDIICLRVEGLGFSISKEISY